ncbi:hypothetical protein [Virgibacillus ihumii]|uniref:hypothetical protein n=1 Tax=Virgibacillus ihumii TaxID=2686091 RepID=UPI00157C0FF5|nr:hypothetical protein [Virgibacillus ihumii]
MPKPDIRPLKENPKKRAVGDARTCYSHIAGELGVKLADFMVDEGFMIKGEKKFYVIDKGENFLRDLGINIPKKEGSKKCLENKTLPSIFSECMIFYMNNSCDKLDNALHRKEAIRWIT